MFAFKLWVLRGLNILYAKHAIINVSVSNQENIKNIIILKIKTLFNSKKKLSWFLHQPIASYYIELIELIYNMYNLL